MLIQMKSGLLKQAPGDLDTDEAAELVADGSAVEVKRLRITRDVRYITPDFQGSWDAGETLTVLSQIPEHVARIILDPKGPLAKHHAHPPAEVIV